MRRYLALCGRYSTLQVDNTLLYYAWAVTYRDSIYSFHGSLKGTLHGFNRIQHWGVGTQSQNIEPFKLGYSLQMAMSRGIVAYYQNAFDRDSSSIKSRSHWFAPSHLYAPLLISISSTPWEDIAPITWIFLPLEDGRRETNLLTFLDHSWECLR